VVDAAIHAGYTYDPFTPINNIQDDYLDGGSVFSELAMAGADVQFFHRGQHCPYLATCIYNSDIRRDTAQLRKAETLYAIDKALLIMSPEPLKNFVYRGGRWLLGSFTAGGGLKGPEKNVFDDHAILDMIADKLQTGGADSSVRYFQLGNTRTPGLLQKSCDVEPGSRGTGKIDQARCALLDLQQILDSLKHSGLYDKTAIVVFAESGAVGQDDSAHGDQPGRLTDSANPLLMIKPMESGGALRIDDRPTRLTDLPKTLCRLTGMCRWPNGNDLLDTEREDPDYRHYLAYSGPQYNPDLGLITGGEQFRINGPVTRAGSWWRVIDDSTVEVTGTLEFSSLDDSRIFGSGWGVVEIDPTAGSKRWVSAKTAELRLDLDPESNYRLEFTVYPAPGADDQSMEMYINGKWVGRHPAPAGVNKLTYTIPEHYILPGIDQVRLEFAKLAEPAGMDERKLAMSFFDMQICRVLPEYNFDPLQAASASE